VASSDPNAVYVIDGDTMKVLDTLKVSADEDVHLSLAIDQFHTMVYAANSDSICVLYGNRKQVQAVVSFWCHPFHAGHIECNNITVPTNEYLNVDFVHNVLLKSIQTFDSIAGLKI
jgi:hypothetical protein